MVIVDVEPGRLAGIESVALRSGRPLVRVTDSWDAIEDRRDELAACYLDLTVRTSGVDTDLADRARRTFPFLVRVRAYRPEATATVRLAKERRGWDDLYEQFYRREFDEAAPAELLAEFRSVLEEAGDASA